MSRAARFAWVGVGGFVVQAAGLQALVSLAGVPYPLATAAGVQAAILHNFLWHERWTWGDRPAHAGRLVRFLRFNGATALISIGGNVALMALFVGQWRWPLLVANAVAVLVLSLANYLSADRLVFTAPARPISHF
jgi:putative flippase GtrA